MPKNLEPTQEDARLSYLLQNGWIPKEQTVDELADSMVTKDNVERHTREMAEPVIQLIHTAAYFRRCKQSIPEAEPVRLGLVERIQNYLDPPPIKKFNDIPPHEDTCSWVAGEQGDYVARKISFWHHPVTDNIELMSFEKSHHKIKAELPFLSLNLEFLQGNKLSSVSLAWSGRYTFVAKSDIDPQQDPCDPLLRFNDRFFNEHPLQDRTFEKRTQSNELKVILPNLGFQLSKYYPTREGKTWQDFDFFSINSEFNLNDSGRFERSWTSRSIRLARNRALDLTEEIAIEEALEVYRNLLILAISN